MTAQPIIELSIDEVIGLNAWALMRQRRVERKRSGAQLYQEEFATAIGISGSVLSKKLRGESAWSAAQVAAAARFLGVAPGRLFEQATAPYIRAKLRAIQGSGSDSPRQRPLLFRIDSPNR